jgi:hypothetical protein
VAEFAKQIDLGGKDLIFAAGLLIEVVADEYSHHATGA